MDETIGRVFAFVCAYGAPASSREMQSHLALSKADIAKATRALLAAGKITKAGRTRATVYARADG